MIDKRVGSLAEALAGIGDGATVLVGGTGAGQPDLLIEALIEQGARGLTIVANDAGRGLARLLDAGRVRRLVCADPSWAGPVVSEDLVRAGGVERAVVPGRTLAERIRAAGAGIPAFFMPPGTGTHPGENRDMRAFDGRRFVLEHALPGDVALIEASEADRWGNLRYRAGGHTLDAAMATAATLTIAQTRRIVELGALDPELIGTPGIFVDRVFAMGGRG